MSVLSNFSDAELRKWADAYGVEHSAKDSRDSLLSKLHCYADGIADRNRPANLPLAPPPFTLKDIKAAIPAHCFERSAARSLMHLAQDLIMIAIIGYLGTFIPSISAKVPFFGALILWPVYWYVQGSVMTGVWVLAHECGHQAFSDSEALNNFVGTICHSLLLVPYHAWRITHGKHHGNTGSCENDEVFAPPHRSDFKDETGLRASPLAMALDTIIMFTVGWIPGYLVFNFTGPAKYRGKNASHFSPDAVFVQPNERHLIVQSNIAFGTALALLAYCGVVYGWINVLRMYFVPYLIVNFHLVLITYLQHTDVFVPHFRGKDWDWLRGALCTVDRSFSPLLDRTLHHITDTHVCHHLFSKMPFYHAHEATEAIKKVIGKYYLRDETPIARAFFRSYHACQFVEDEGGAVWYKNKW